MNDCIDLLKEVEEGMKSLNDIDGVVYSLLYKITAAYYEKKEKFSEFYQAGLQYLAYTPTSDISPEEQKNWSIKMGMAVVLGKEIYNIAELLEKDVLKALHGTDHEWLFHMLQAMETGNISEFERVCEEHNVYSADPVIEKNKTQLSQKIRILAFLDLIFHKEKGERHTTFDEVSVVS